MVGWWVSATGKWKTKKVGKVFCQGQQCSCQIFFGNHGMVVEELFMVDQKGDTARCTHEKNTRHSRARVKRGGWKLQNIYLWGARLTI
jgi:hypothetical protein